MRTKIAVAIFAVFAICSVASAQEYSIRVTNNTNLRATYSLKSAVVEKVQAGTTLQVAGTFNRWLRINRNGTVWMADWVGFTRLGSDDQTTAQTPVASQVDNCCFVDRQCNTDVEWQSGYWAFQNHQCNAAEQSQPGASTLPETPDASQVDNCCYLGWICVSDDKWARGYVSYYNQTCDAPSQASGIKLEGPDIFINRINAALDLLKSRAPDWYAYAIGGLDKIVVDTDSNPGADYYTRTWHVDASRSYVNGISEWNTIHLSSVIVHEACHIHRYEAGYAYYGRQAEEEKACTQAMLDASKAIDPIDRLTPWLQGLIDNIHNPEYQWWN